ncbi:MAG: hypoxanthine-guanine phosphoribosyltransferase [Hydrogenophilus sp.]|nr:hypoxanthine-guanine phosphoribosyltransferase [Hydrogenophilus sp.]
MGSPSLTELWQILRDADCLADHAMVQAAIDRIAHRITADYVDRYPLIYIVLTGGVVFAGQLLPRLYFPLEIAYLHATRYRGTTTGGQIYWQVEPTPSPQGRHVLVLDDILDEGHTLVAVRERLLAEGAATVALAVLCDKDHTRKAIPGLKADYTGLTLPDRYLFGYGLDYRGHWRNAPGIYAVRGC